MDKITRLIFNALLAWAAMATVMLPFSDEYRAAAHTEIVGMAALSAHFFS